MTNFHQHCLFLLSLIIVAGMVFSPWAGGQGFKLQAFLTTVGLRNKPAPGSTMRPAQCLTGELKGRYFIHPRVQVVHALHKY
jgi:hypothetical protein